MVHKGFDMTYTNELLANRFTLKPKTQSFLTLLETPNRDEDYLEQFDALRGSIRSPSLAKFLNILFSDPDIAIPFIEVPASINHHHAVKGGLLMHSVEAALVANQLDYKNSGERDISIVATLLHDIGKIKSYTTNGRTTNLGKLVCHDHLTLEVCAVALRSLDQDWPDAANTLRHIWTCASAGSRYGFQPSTPLANIVKFSDKFSVDNYDHDNAFKKNIKSSGFAWDAKRYFWNPTNEKIKPERRRICF
jgi:3'-5' exoribonuclease